MKSLKTLFVNSKVKVNYYGKAENVFDEDDQTTYTWFYVEIPEMKKEGWVRSDMLEDYEEVKETIYVMASNREEISLYEDADLNSDIKETVSDNEITFTYKAKTTTETTAVTTTESTDCKKRKAYVYTSCTSENYR